MSLSSKDLAQRIIAHRAGAGEAPENTVAAIKRAAALPIFGIEIDVHLSRDGEPVVIHQETFKPDWDRYRLQLVPGDPTVSWTLEYPLEKLRSLDAGVWFNERWIGEKIPSLSDVVGIVGEKNLVVELKDHTFWKGDLSERWGEEIVPRADRVLNQSGVSYQFLSFSDGVLSVCKKLSPNTPRILAIWTECTGKHSDVIKRAKHLKLRAITMPDFMVLNDPTWISKLSEVGIDTWVYEVTPDSDRLSSFEVRELAKRWDNLIKLGVHGIATDFPKAMSSKSYR